LAQRYLTEAIGRNGLGVPLLLNIDASGHRTIGNRTQDGKKVGSMNVSRTSVRHKEVRQRNNGSK
jgi:hypothetical protein